MKTLDQLVCEKCGYRWFQRTEKKPVKCPECQSRSWDKQKEQPETAQTLPITGATLDVTQKAHFQHP